MVQKNTIKEKCYFIRIGVHMTSGKVLYNGKEYNSLGGATKAIGSGASGFVFWQIQDHKNRWVTLRALREKSRAFKKVA